MVKKDTALLKRQQIAKANRMMFMWIIGASVLVGAASVSSLFMVRTLAFNNRVIAAKNKTVDTLKKNNEAVDKLRENVRILNTDPALESSKAFSDEQTIRVILDALPDSENVPALGASIQKELVNVPGVDLESLSFASAGSGTTATVAEENTVAFDMKLTAGASGNTSPTEKLRKVLVNLERSIRAIKITNSKLEVAGSTATLTISAVAYYQPAITLELKDTSIKP